MFEASHSRSIHEQMRATSQGLTIPPGMGFDAWATMGRRIAGISNACAWCLGDWLAYGERTFPARYKTALAATSLDYQTLRNYAWVARRFDVSRRRDKLSFQHHAEVAALPEAEQDRWLLQAERSQWSRNELRRRLRTARRASGGGISEAPVSVRLELTKTREERWRLAASAAQQTLPEWIAAAVDAAAEAALIGPRPSPVDERLETDSRPLSLPG